jgi:hypothetical protein
MEGDKDMLLRFSSLWLARFSGSAQPPPELPQQQQPQQGDGQVQDQQHSRQQQATEPAQQQEEGSPQQQQQAGTLGLPGRKGPADFEGAAAAGSFWLTFLRAAYQVGPRTQRNRQPCKLPMLVALSVFGATKVRFAVVIIAVVAVTHSRHCCGHTAQHLTFGRRWHLPCDAFNLQDLWQGTSKPVDPKAAAATSLMLVGPLLR